MEEKYLSQILSDWLPEFSDGLLKNDSFYIALFTIDGDLIFANKSMSALFKEPAIKSFINPTFDKLIKTSESLPLVFEGYLTLGDYSSVNFSIWAQVYRRHKSLLIIGGVNGKQLMDQNKMMHQLNREIGNLQRNLIKEKNALEKALEQLNNTNNYLKELNLSKDRFISILAHDLKSPFNTIIGFINLLKENINIYDINQIERQINIIDDTAKRTYTMLEDILLWVKAESDKIPYNPKIEQVDLIIHKIIEYAKPIANRKNIRIIYEPRETLTVFADVNMLETILRNLLSNAIKFTNSLGIITIQTAQEATDIIFKVSDNGVGIHPITVQKLFDISEKITTEGTENEKGTGLGLLLCKEFVQKHGGKIWVESILNKGSDFIFSIPNKL